MKISQKLSVLVSVSIISLMTVAGIGWHGIYASNRDMNQIVEQQVRPLVEVNVQRVIELNDGIALVLNADRDAYQAYLAERETLQLSEAEALTQAQADNTENLDQVSERMDKAAQLFGTVGAQEYAKFKQAYEQWRKTSQQVLTLAQSPEQKDQARQLSQEQSGQQFDTMRELINTITEIAEAEIANQNEDTQAKFQATIDIAEKAGKQGLKSIASFITLAAVISGVLLIMGFVMSRSICRGLTAISQMIRDIAQGDGDLTQRVDQERKDELGELGRWFNVFIQTIHDIIAQVAQNTLEVTASSTQIAATSEQIATGMSQQSNQSTQVACAVDQMSSTVSEIASKSAEAARLAQQAGQRAVDGGAVVGQTIDGINEISRMVNSSAQAVEELGRRGEQIGEIINVINDIADQTNLLALNAAIEAARAGEHGRGFAVVADEVRKLAERTTQATKQVADSIKTIQSETQQAVERMQTGTGAVEKGVGLATQAQEALKLIVEGSNQLSSMVQAIAAATEEQSATTVEISRNVETINSITRQISEGTEQAASASSQLSHKAECLNSVVGRFKL